MIELRSPIPNGKAIRRKFTTKMEDTTSESPVSLMNLFPKCRLMYSAEIKTEIKAETNAIVTENSNPRVPTRGKKVSIKDIKTIIASEIRTFFEKNISIKVIRAIPNLFGFSINFNTILSNQETK